MSTPHVATPGTVTLSDIRNEILGAASSMNMPPEPRDDIDQSKIDQSEVVFMTDLYYYAKHAHEHIVAAMQNLQTLQKELRSIEFELYEKGEHALRDRMYNLLR